ncbi:MAG TPA: M20/M25/M40 family metallo-hydrolase [Gemmatimonadaceae bacterium]|nr:M20/M25/M40 family metallo-hydrolase [Gemmatimonadaceae bacterium]
MKLLSMVIVGFPLVVNAQTADTTGNGALISQAMDHSEVMQNLAYLSDAIGPRLSGSPAMRKANDWTAQRFRDYGLTASLEEYSFGPAWSRGPLSAQLTAPFTRQINAWSWAWTAGTGGRPAEGRVIRIDATNADSLAKYVGRVRGAWVMQRPSSEIWNPDGPDMTARDSARVRDIAERARLERARLDTSAVAVEQRRQFSVDAPYILKRAGALGVITDGGKEFGLATMSGSPNRISPLPNIVVAHEDYTMLERMLKGGRAPRFSATITNTMGTRPVSQWNTVAEIRGAKRPGEVVILGAHLDSWDIAEGTTDNGTGSMVVLEAARILARSGVRPDRTIRFILFSGEEEGLLGSRAYAAAHARDADSVQAVLVLDNGTGMITGQALQGRDQDSTLWRQLLTPVVPLGVRTLRSARKTGTDHLSFEPYGVPAWNFDQMTRGYNHTHHSQVDTFDHAVESDLKQASAVMAVTALELANYPTLLARGAKTPVTPIKFGVPSPGLK